VGKSFINGNYYYAMVLISLHDVFLGTYISLAYIRFHEHVVFCTTNIKRYKPLSADP